MEVIMYDIRKIKEEVKAINIIRYLGIKYQRSGKNIFILCPEHESRTGQEDHHIGNCVINNTFNSAYYCYGCGASGDCFRLIALLEHLDLKEDFSKILDIAVASCGGGEYFSLSKEETIANATKKATIKNNPLTNEQLKSIHLSPSYYPSTVIEYFGNDNFGNDNLVKDVSFSIKDHLDVPYTSYLFMKNFPYSITDILNTNYSLYVYIVKNKAFEMMDKYKQLASKNWSAYVTNKESNQSFYEKITEFYKNKYLEVFTIWKQFASTEELDSIDNSWIFGYDIPIINKPGTIL